MDMEAVGVELHSGRADPALQAKRMATAQGLSSVGAGAIACVLLHGSDETDSAAAAGHLAFLDGEGRTLRLGADFPTAGADGPAAFASIADRDARLLAFYGGDGRSAVCGIGAAPAPAPEQAGDVLGEVVAVADDGKHAALVVETAYAEAPPSQSILRMVDADGGGEWEAVDTGPLNLGPQRVVTRIALRAGMLHAAVADPVGGCDLFRMPLGGDRPAWQTVFTRGGDRFALNAAISAMTWAGEELLLGTAALAAGAIAVGNWGPELLVVSPDGSWDLLIGQPRLSPSGLKLPASALTPGIESPGNAAITAIASGPASGCPVVLAMQDYAGPEPGDRTRLRPLLDDYCGAARFYRSDDLLDWSPLDVTLPADAGRITALCITGSGLLIGHQGAAEDRAPVTFAPL